MSVLYNHYPGDNFINLIVAATICAALVSMAGIAAARSAGRNCALRHCILFAAFVAVAVAPLLAPALASLGLQSVSIPLLAASETPKAQASLSVDAGIASLPASDEMVIGRPVTTLPSAPRSPLTTPRSGAMPVEGSPSVASVISKDTPQFSVQTTPKLDLLRTFLTACYLVWLAGVAALGFRIIVAIVRLEAIRRCAQSISIADFHDLVSEVQQRIGASHFPRVVESDRVSTPIAMGIIRPLVILPTGLSKCISRDQISDILVHECAHLLRRDQFIVVWESIVQSLFWPNLPVRWLCSQLDSAREEVCDNYVLASRDGVAYGETLYQMALLASAPRSQLAVGIMSMRGKLETRIVSITSGRREIMTHVSRINSLAAFFVFAVASILLCSATFVSAQATPPKNSDRLAEQPTKEAQVELRAGSEAPRPDVSVSTLAFSRDGQVIAGGSGDSKVRIWDAANGECLHTLDGQESRIRAVYFTPDGKSLLSLADDVRRWDVNTWALVKATELEDWGNRWTYPADVRFSPDGTLLAAVGGIREQFRLYDVASGELRHQIVVPGAALSVDFAPDGRTVAVGIAALAAGTNSDDVQIYDAANGELLRSYEVGGSVSSLAFSPDGKSLCCASRRKVLLLSLADGRVEKEYPNDSGLIKTVCFSPNGEVLATGGEGPWLYLPHEQMALSETKVRDLKSDEQIWWNAGEVGLVTSIAFSPHGARLARSDERTVVMQPLTGSGLSWLRYYSDSLGIGDEINQARASRRDQAQVPK